jgi:5-methyltetrahydrofolate--homocysteine methyltransferase
MSHFLRTLQSGQVLLMDGAMGTELQRAGLAEGQCHESWNLAHRERVRAVHARYANAGSQCLVTNTFQSNPANLARHHLQAELEAINRQGIALARAESGENVFVLASIGPMSLEGNDFDRVVRSLSTADALLLETWSGESGIAAAKRACDPAVNTRRLPVLLSFTFRADSSGSRKAVVHEGELGAAEIAERAHSSGIAALGVNCGREIDPAASAEILRDYRRATDLPLFARPNAGTPSRQGDRWIYPRTPERMAAGLTSLLQAGAAMVGGCCGTTPEHIAAFKPIVNAWNQRPHQ